MKKIVIMLALFVGATFHQAFGVELIARLTVDTGLDKATVDCSNKGTFSELKFRVEGAEVDFRRVYIKYGTGAISDLKFEETVRPGRDSGWLDLRGGRRVIKEIIIYYKAESSSGNNGRGKGGFKGRQAKVQVWGR